MWRFVLAGLALWLLATLIFRFAGQFFFVPDDIVLTIIHVVIAPILFFGTRVILSACGLTGPERLRATAALIIPGLLLDAAVVSHFALVFPNLEPSLDKAFGGFLLWSYGFILWGGATGARSRAA